MEEDGILYFLDVLIFWHDVCQKHTHRVSYLKKTLTTITIGIIKTLSDRARNNCQTEDIKAEMKILK